MKNKDNYLTSIQLSEILKGNAKLTDFFPKPVPRIPKVLIEGEEEKPDEGKEITKAASLLYSTFKEIIPTFRGTNCHSRLRSVMAFVKNYDTKNKKGARTVTEGFKTAEGKAMFVDFELQHKIKIKKVLHHPFVFDIESNSLQLKQLNAFSGISRPSNATNVGFKLFKLNVDFENEIVDIKSSEEVIIQAYSHELQDILLKITEPCYGEGIDIYLFEIRFYEVLNGRSYNCCSRHTATIIGVN